MLLFGFALTVGVLQLSLANSGEELQKLMKVWKAGSVTYRYSWVLDFFTKISYSLIIASKYMNDDIYMFVQGNIY